MVEEEGGQWAGRQVGAANLDRLSSQEDCLTLLPWAAAPAAMILLFLSAALASSLSWGTSSPHLVLLGTSTFLTFLPVDGVLGPVLETLVGV